MSLSAALLPEFDQEMATTRRVLLALPADRYGWRPHEKAWTLAGLATHIASIPGWAGITLGQDSFDLAPPGVEPPKHAEAASPDELLARFDQAVAGARAAIAGASDAAMMQPWTLLKGGQAMMTLPRVAVLRGFVMNHLIHHRGQLSMGLRVAGLKVPSIYGPTADESPW